MKINLKACLVSCATMVFVHPLTAQTPSDSTFDVKEITGSWEGTVGKGVTGVFQFQPGGYIQIISNNGKRLVPMDPNGPSLKFKIDQSKSPMWLDFIAFDPAGKELGRMKFIMQRIGANELKIRSGENPSIRPDKFDDSDTSSTAIFKRVY